MISPRTAQTCRITFSALCGIAAVLFVALWVRSYWTGDCVTHSISGKGLAQIHSQKGHLIYTCDKTNLQPHGWKIETNTFSMILQMIAGDHVWGAGSTPTGDFRLVPHWFPVLFFAFLAPIPWLLRHRFSLRTLLVATALLGVVLAVFLWLIRDTP